MLEELIDAINSYRHIHSICEPRNPNFLEPALKTLLHDAYVNMLNVCDKAQSGLTPRALDDAEVCDCGEPFPENGECKFCGARARHRQ